MNDVRIERLGRSSRPLRFWRTHLLGPMAVLFVAFATAQADDLLRQNFDTDPVNYGTSGFFLQNPATGPNIGTRYFNLSNVAGIVLNPGITGADGVYVTVQDADICSESVWPEDESKTLGAGLLFWGEDTRTYFQFGILNNGKFWIARRYDGKWHTVVENVPSRAIETKPGATNKLRVKVSGNSASFYINGSKVRDLRGQPPKAGWRSTTGATTSIRRSSSDSARNTTSR